MTGKSKEIRMTNDSQMYVKDHVSYKSETSDEMMKRTEMSNLTLSKRHQ